MMIEKGNMMICIEKVMVAAMLLTTISAVAGVEGVKIDCDNPGQWKFDLTTANEGGAEVVTVKMTAPTESVPPKFKVCFEMPGVGVQHIWTSNYRKGYNLWPSAWLGDYQNESELACEMPLAVAFGPDETSRLAIASSEVFEKVQYGLCIKESTAVLQGFFTYFSGYASPRKKYEVKMYFNSNEDFWADAVRSAAFWIDRTAGFKAAEVPESARDPLYSTWYAYWQDVHAEELEREAVLAAKLGMKTMILDDGWQKVESKTFYSATGDWQPVASRFPDMKAHVAAVHKAGLKYMLWVSVPYVGDESKAWQTFKDKMLYSHGGKSPGKVGVLDPRFPEVREYLIKTYERIVGEWGFDGIKLDFIDQFAYVKNDPALKDNYAGRDYKSVPEAVDRLMKDILARLKAIKPEVFIEFRQRYVGPAIRQYGNMLRAADCPVDPWSNRKRICDLRLTSGGTAVHSDMIVWNKDETATGAALPILNALFSTIQYSMVLSKASELHREVIRHWIDFSQKHRKTLLKGEFRPRHPENFYPVIEAESEDESIIAIYNSMCVTEIYGCKPTIVINATNEKRIILELKNDVRFTVYDTLGRKCGSGDLLAGLRSLQIPAAGYIEIMPIK